MKHIKTIVFCNVLLFSLSLFAQNIPVQQMPEQQLFQPESLYCQAFLKTIKTMLEHPENQALLNSLPTDIKEPIMDLLAKNSSVDLLQLLNLKKKQPFDQCPKTIEKISQLINNKWNDPLLYNFYKISEKKHYDLNQAFLSLIIRPFSTIRAMGESIDYTSQEIENALKKVLDDFWNADININLKFNFNTYRLKHLPFTLSPFDESKNDAAVEPIITYALKKLSLSQNYQEGEIITDFLLKHKVDLNVNDNNGNTPLMYASAYAPTLIFNTIVQNTKNINHKNNNGENALLYMIRNSKLADQILIARAEQLINKGINIFEYDNQGINALEEAQQKHKWKLIQLYQRFRSETFPPQMSDAKKNTMNIINLKNNNGENLLLRVIRDPKLSEEQQVEAAKKLIAAGVDIFAEDNNGINALEEAQQKNKLQLLQLLQDHIKSYIASLQQ